MFIGDKGELILEDLDARAIRPLLGTSYPEIVNGFEPPLPDMRISYLHFITERVLDSLGLDRPITYVMKDTQEDPGIVNRTTRVLNLLTCSHESAWQKYVTRKGYVANQITNCQQQMEQEMAKNKAFDNEVVLMIDHTLAV